MRRTLFALLLISSAAYGANRTTESDRAISQRIAASHHVILTPAHALSAADRAELSARGIEIKEAVGGGRVLLRVPPGAALDEHLGAVEALTAQKKIHPSAIREAAKGRAFARLDVVFHDDVPFDEARDLITATGGALDDPLQLEFDTPSRIQARVPSPSVMALASDERILLVYASRRLQATTDNLKEAQASRVDIAQAAPYNLTGTGVVMSYFELVAGESVHPEFEGRLTTHGPFSTGDTVHPTHTAGTMIAAGLNPSAKGMAPKATLHEFSASGAFSGILTQKRDLSTYGSTADNNSWSYILGWCLPGGCRDDNNNVVTEWEWEDTNEYYGAYDFTYSAGIDAVARSSNALMIHSAGNDNEKFGPSAPWYVHRHYGDTTHTFCYSQNGSGTDCPSPCSAGVSFCEITKHPLFSTAFPQGPWTTVGITASAKNVLAVGAVDENRDIAYFSSRGPMLDGRLKPEIVAKGVSVFSTSPGGGYATKSGTSMSAPVVAGIAALLTEQYRKTFGGADPAPVTLKTLLIAGAQDLGNPGGDYTYGFGLADAKSSADVILSDNGIGRRLQTGSVSQGQQVEFSFALAWPQKVRVALGWVDPEVLILPGEDFAVSALVNNLDLRVLDPTGNTVLPWVLDKVNPSALATRAVNMVDNIEVVDVPTVVPGVYTVIVSGTRITTSSAQSFVVAVNDFAVPCIDESNNSESSAFNLVTGRGADGRVCDFADADYFRFVTSKAGAVSVAVTATDTAVRVTLTSPATTGVTVTVAPNTTQTLTTQVATAVATTFVVKVEVAGTVGSSAAYTIQPTYPFTSPTRRRAVTR